MALRRRLRPVLAAAALLVAFGAGSPSAHAQVNLKYACSPPLPASAANCSGWHTSPVTLLWDWDQTLADPVPPGSCDKQTFAADTVGTQVTCEVQAVGESDKRTVTIKVDVTPPAVAAVTPSRPPDHGDWWNHPLDVSFAGADATSGVAACDRVSYSGPDAAPAQVSGGCRDAAGNVTTVAFQLKYDATPPSVTHAVVDARDGSAVVRWQASADVVRSEITRVAGRTGSPFTTVLTDPMSRFKDTGLENGVVYRYTVRVFDAADNSSTATAAGRPRASKHARTTTQHPALPLLRWPGARGADYYNVQVFRRGHKILSAWPRQARLALRRTWTFHGHRYRLTRGRYRWYVWPGYGRPSAHRYGALIRAASLYFKP